MKKYKSRILVLLSTVLLTGATGYAQSIHFNYTDGTNASYDLEDIHKITFDSDVMNLHLWDDTIYTWNISSIDHYQYGETPVNIQDWFNSVNAWEVSIFPNPASTDLYIQFNLQKEDDISISLFDMQGKLILENSCRQASGANQEVININHIPRGTYFCRISGRQKSISKQVIIQ